MVLEGKCVEVVLQRMALARCRRPTELRLLPSFPTPCCCPSVLHGELLNQMHSSCHSVPDQIMLFIEFDGGHRQLYACTDPAAADACALTSPDHPETAPGCTPVDK